jgi:hypothetical protein
VSEPRSPRAADLTQSAPLAEQAVLVLAFNANSTLLAAGTNSGTVALWRVTGANSLRPAAASPFAAALAASTVQALAFSPVDPGLLATGGSDGATELWNVTNPARPAEYPNLSSATDIGVLVRTLAFSHDGRLLASGTAAGNIGLWTVSDPAHPVRYGQEFAASSNSSTVYSLTFSPLRSGYVLASGDADTTTKLWILNTSYAKAQVCALAAGNLTAALWKLYIPELPYRPPCPAQAAAVSTPALGPAPALSAAELSGTWTGTYFCASAGTLHADVTMAAAPDGTLSGLLAFSGTPTNPQPSGSFTVTGTYSPAGVTLAQGHWVSQPRGWVMVNLIANAPAASGTKLTGIVAYPLCTTFTLSKER